MEFNLVIRGGVAVTMDAARRVIQDSVIGVSGRQIVLVGESRAFPKLRSETEVDASGCVVMPGLIDTHAHAGHGLTKTLGEGGFPENWDDFMERLYFQGTDPEFWMVEARLSGLEKLMFGVTTGMSMLGSYPRYDDPDCWAAHADGMAEVGIRDILGIGTPNPPFPKTFRTWNPDGTFREYCLGHSDSFEKTRKAVGSFHGKNGGLSLCYPTPSGVGRRDGLTLDEHKAQNKAMRDISDEFGAPVHSHSYAGDILFAREHFPFMLGPRLSLAHCTGISSEEVAILAGTGTHVCSGPSTGSYINARCPVVELIDAGCNVAFCTDASAPDRTYDLFEKMRIGVRLHRVHFHDTKVLPAGKALEMVTIDAAKALGLDSQIGSLEAGKNADLTIVDMKKPHLAPHWHEPLRLVYQAAGQDVATVVVSGKILMRDRKVLHMDVAGVLDAADKKAWEALRRIGMEKSAELPDRLWGVTHY